jgi:hypothetical protein
MNQYFGVVVLCMVGITFSAAAMEKAVAMEKYNPLNFVHTTRNKKIAKPVASNRNVGQNAIKSKKDARSFIPVFKKIQNPKKEQRSTFTRYFEDDKNVCPFLREELLRSNLNWDQYVEAKQQSLETKKRQSELEEENRRKILKSAIIRGLQKKKEEQEKRLANYAKIRANLKNWKKLREQERCGVHKNT